MFLGHAAKSIVLELLDKAGIQINGTNPWDIQVHDERFYDRVLRYNSLGLGESYTEGWWDCECIDKFITNVLNAYAQVSQNKNVRFLPRYLLNVLFNLQSKAKSKIVAEQHYDLGNDLYKAMLDKEMIYSCGYWAKAATLDQAQLDKLELTCQKLQLRPGMRLLDIGCGWGGMAKYAAIHYGVEVVGITISKEQKVLAEENCKGLPVEIRLQDYRDLHEKFDRIVSIGMFEHVGYKNYREYMEVVNRNLKGDGIFLLHTIGNNVSVSSGDYWMSKYIFPGGMLPSIAQIGKAIEKLFVMEDMHNFGADYDRTLLAWHQNFNNHWQQLKGSYDEKFKRMWNFYLLSCAGGFRARKTQLWQFVLSKNGLKGGFRRENLNVGNAWSDLAIADKAQMGQEEKLVAD